MTRRIEVIAVEGVARVYPGDDVVALLGAALAGAGPPQAGDVLVVTHKILSKAQGRTVLLSTLNPSPEAEELAHATGKDPAFVEAVLSESRRIVRHCPGVIIAEHRLVREDINGLAGQRFGVGLTRLNKLQASGLIDELFESYGHRAKSRSGSQPVEPGAADRRATGGPGREGTA